MESICDEPLFVKLALPNSTPFHLKLQRAAWHFSPSLETCGLLFVSDILELILKHVELPDKACWSEADNQFLEDRLILQLFELASFGEASPSMG
ncbi:hypothetical protein MKZ38_001117 [Zalerion maritima]|uniref:Uncharacterized protein n=1 Tax=Zalerion maritima TaxID=339359 RepID=A0AAD5WTG9_9PEZI|nr:hypothetical protein MKZ38_001117 [Zalerion maritima]